MLHVLPIDDNTPTLTDLQSSARIIAQTWYDSMGGKTRPFYAQRILAWLQSGFEQDLILAAMATTFEAPEPSWRYLEAIIRRCGNEGCFTGMQWLNRRPVRSAF